MLFSFCKFLVVFNVFSLVRLHPSCWQASKQVNIKVQLSSSPHICQMPHTKGKPLQTPLMIFLTKIEMQANKDGGQNAEVAATTNMDEENVNTESEEISHQHVV